MITIAVANSKGGTGKTTSAVNLAALLAQYGKPTVLVDLDHQGHSTRWFLDEDIGIEYDLCDVIVANVPTAKAVRQTRIDRLAILPATGQMELLEVEIARMIRREDRVQRALDQIAGDYDVAVLDLPPRESLTTLAALVAADEVVVPVAASWLALDGLEAFLSWTSGARAEGLAVAPVMGVLRTMTDVRNRVTREVAKTLADTDLPVFSTSIPRRTAAEDQVVERLVAGDPDACADLTEAYRRFTDEVVQQLGERHGK